ncbi:hypothetical protein [Sphingobacterium sp. SGG-5]|nr:hypothetical protein [Sphingobacterium sp. SGG-5]
MNWEIYGEFDLDSSTILISEKLIVFQGNTVTTAPQQLHKQNGLTHICGF